MTRTRRIIKEAFVAPLLERKSCLVAIVGALFLMSTAQGLFLVLVGPFLKALFGAGVDQAVSAADLLPANVLKVFPSLGNFSYSRAQLTRGVPLLLFIAGLTQAAASYWYQLNQQKIALWVTTRYREKLFAALIGQDFEAIAQRSPARWMSVIMNDVLYLQIRFSDIISSLMRDGVLIIACLIAIATVHAPTALILLLLAPLVAASMGRAGGRIAHFAREWQSRLGSIASAILDVRRRFAFIRAQRGEEWERRRFQALNDGYYRLIRRSILLRSAFAPAVEFFGFTLFAAFIFAASRGWWVAGFDAAALIQFFAALGVMLRPLRNIGEQLTRFQETRGSLADSLRLLESAPPPHAVRPSKSLPATISIAKMQLERARGFSLDLADLALESGKAIAVIGPSGAGKSTLIKIFAGLIPPATWNGNTAAEDMAGASSFVSQTPFLFSGSIFDNLAYGLNPAPTEDEVWRALALVNLDADVRVMPQGLATMISALRGGVSGGQLQRLVIARAILQKKDIWIFDEATSAVDATTERDITLRAIAHCKENKRRLVSVTHRLRWLDAFDEVWFLEDGRLSAKGPHQELLKSPRYRQFVSTGDNG